MQPPPGLDLGPPPGLQKVQTTPNATSLESLKLALKVTVQDQQFDQVFQQRNFSLLQIPFSDEYLEPSMNNLISCNGYLCDTSGADVLGLWNQDMQLIAQYKGLVENMEWEMKPVHDKIIMNQKDALYLIDLQKAQKNIILDQVVDYFSVTDHTNPRIVAISDGSIYLYKLQLPFQSNVQEPKFNNLNTKSKKEKCDLLGTISCDDYDGILQLQNGLVLCKQTTLGEVFVVDFEKGQIYECQNTQGCPVTCWTPINYDSVAFAGKNQIIVVQFESINGNIRNIINCQEINHGLCYAGNKLFSITQNAVVLAWNISNAKQLGSAELRFCEGYYTLDTLNQNYIIAKHKENKDFAIFSTKLEKKFVHKARVKQVQNCVVSNCGSFLALVQSYGLYYDEQMNFHNEIEIFPLKDKTINIQKRKDIENVESITVQFGADPNTLMYISKSQNHINPLIIIWNFVTQESKEIELLIPKYKSIQLYQKKLVISHNLILPQQQGSFNIFAPIKKQDAQSVSGVSVFDNATSKNLLKVTFQQQFDAEVYGMPNDQILFILNSKNQIEKWDVTTQSIIQKADCRPSIIKNIKFSENYLFLVAQLEWTVRDVSLGLVGKTQGKRFQKVAFLEQSCIVLSENQLTYWDLQSNKTRLIEKPFSVNNFCLLQGKVLAIGDSQMKLLNI